MGKITVVLRFPEIHYVSMDNQFDQSRIETWVADPIASKVGKGGSRPQTDTNGEADFGWDSLVFSHPRICLWNPEGLAAGARTASPWRVGALVSEAPIVPSWNLEFESLFHPLQVSRFEVCDIVDWIAKSPAATLRGAVQVCVLCQTSYVTFLAALRTLCKVLLRQGVEDSRGKKSRMSRASKMVQR